MVESQFVFCMSVMRSLRVKWPAPHAEIPRVQTGGLVDRAARLGVTSR